MDEETTIQLFTLAREITTTGILIAAIWGFLTGRIVTRFHYDEMKSVLQERINRLKAQNGQNT